jgi:hypothetical protein
MYQKYYVWVNGYILPAKLEDFPKEVQDFFNDYQGNVIVLEGVIPKTKEHYFGIFLLYPNGLLEFLNGSDKDYKYVVKIYFTKEAYNIKPNWIYEKV